MSETFAMSDAISRRAAASDSRDPFAADALLHAGTQTGRFLALLALIERTVMPRTLTIETDTAMVSLDVADRKLALLPRRHNAYAVDPQLADEAPKMHRLLRKRAQAVRKSSHRLAPAREPLLRCAGRLLWALADTGQAQSSISVVTRDEIAAGMSFSALELYRSAASQHAAVSAGAASSYFEAMKPRALSAWRATRGGWVLDWPPSGDTRAALRSISRICAAAEGSSGWLARAGVEDQSSLSFLSGTGHRTIRCIAADDQHVAHLVLQPSAWSGALQTWDAICAGPAPQVAASNSDTKLS